MKIQLTKILNMKIQKAGKLTIERTVFRSNKEVYCCHTNDGKSKSAKLVANLHTYERKAFKIIISLM